MSPPPNIQWFARLVAVVRALVAQVWCLAVVRASLASNAQAFATELRETGELTQLLARAAAGHPLDDVERAKVRAQLIDVAKAVPALALLAAPGGLLLLPLLAKVLPWNMLPSAWDQPRVHARPVLPAKPPDA